LNDLPQIERYEIAFAHLVGRRNAFAFAYARTGLVAIMQAAGLGPGDEVILSPLTCKVVPLALLSMGLKPVYADISSRTLNLDPDRAGALVRRATRAIVFQHTYGNAEGVEGIAEICARNALLLVEDCAQAVPQVGKISTKSGHAAIYSNNPRKPVPAGSGGVVATDDAALAESIKRIRNGLPKQASFERFKWGVNVLLHDVLVGPRLYWPLFSIARKLGSVYRERDLRQEIALDIAQVATQVSGFHLRRGMASLPKISALAAQRMLSCESYASSFLDYPEIMPLPATREPLYFFPILVADKERLLRKARQRLLELVSWPMRLPIYPVESEKDLLRYGYELGSCLVAERIATRLVGLPTDFGATERGRAALVALIREHHGSPR
jgi:dTDP-4-amino-4,6-dideoxygalactose transaminase